MSTMTSANDSGSTTRNNHGSEPGDNISLFYIYFGILLIVPYTFYLILVNDPSSLGWFAYHPPLCVLAFAAIAHGITPLQIHDPNVPLVERVNSHQNWLAGLALPLLIVSVGLEWQQKDDKGKDHLTSWHGLLGLSAASVLILQALFGGATTWYGGAAVGGPTSARKLFKYHRQSGYILFTLLYLVITLGGLFSNFVVGKTWLVTRSVVYGLGPFCVLGGVWSRMSLRKLM